MRIACVGGGPAGLYFSLLMKLWRPENDVTVFERNPEGVTQGWGVVMEAKFLARLARLDAESAAEIERASIAWQDQLISFRGGRDLHRENGHTFGVSRQRLVNILAARAAGLGVKIRYSSEVRAAAELPDADLIVVADGVNSQLRGSGTAFGTSVRSGRNLYTWLGTSKPYSSFNFFFEQTDAGWIWAHAYQHEPGASTFIVECAPATWAALGFDDGPAGDSLGRLEEIFAEHLDGHPLLARSPGGTEARWLSFRTVASRRWHDGRVVLVGDSAHTAHFSLGLGTTLALEDVIALAGHLRQAGIGAGGGAVPAVRLGPPLQAYQEQRQAELRQHATDAGRSAAWFEHLPRYAGLPAPEFATVLHSRRAPLLPFLPPRLFCHLYAARERFPALDALRALASR